MTEKEIERLVRYLKENDAYVAYRKYVGEPLKYATTCTRSHFSSTKEFLKEIEYCKAINCAFYWMITDEGDAFWRNLSQNIIYKTVKTN